MKRTLFMRCFPSMEDMVWGRYGVLSFDDAWLSKLWRMVRAYKAAKADVPSLAELVVWDYQVSFYDKVDMTEAQEERLEKYDYIEGDLPKFVDEHLTRTECEEMHMVDDGKYVYWSVIVKHTDVRVYTPRILLTDFECALRGQKRHNRRSCLACIARM